jgi:hypothetical protein
MIGLIVAGKFVGDSHSRGNRAHTSRRILVCPHPDSQVGRSYRQRTVQRDASGLAHHHSDQCGTRSVCARMDRSETVGPRSARHVTLAPGRRVAPSACRSLWIWTSRELARESVGSLQSSVCGHRPKPGHHSSTSEPGHALPLW